MAEDSEELTVTVKNKKIQVPSKLPIGSELISQMEESPKNTVVVLTYVHRPFETVYQVTILLDAEDNLIGVNTRQAPHRTALRYLQQN